MITLYDIKIGK